MPNLEENAAASEVTDPDLEAPAIPVLSTC